jgi:apolipoprotein N-acyltransferase
MTTSVVLAPSRRIPTAALLALGAILLAASGYRWGVPGFAWIAPVPFLLVMRRAGRWRDRLAVLGVLAVALVAMVAKIVTPPIPWLMVFPFALPAALTAWLILLATETARRRAGELAALLAFPALSALGEWLTYSLAPLGTWGTLSVTQVDNLELLQLASIAGAAGIGFVMSLAAAAIALLLGAAPARRHTVAALAVAGLVAVVHAWGAIRVYRSQGDRTVTVAAVVTDVGPGADGMPDAAALSANEDALFARTRLAAARGARLIAWNEVATLIWPDDEARFLDRGRALARELGVEIVLAYGLVVRDAPMLVDNQYVWLDPAGETIETYRKHHPVPGEFSMTGTAPLVAHDHPWGRAAGAICYDYDFPALARAHARLGAGLVVVPSSDWLGIDPYHTQITRIRAIEGGFSVLRPTRWAMSAAYDAFGRTRATMSAWEDHDQVMVATLPVDRVETIYARTGDVPLVFLSLALLSGVVVVAARARRSGRGAVNGG